MSLTGPPTCVSGNLCRLSSHSTLVISGASVSRRAVLSSLILVSPGFSSKLSKLQEGRAIVCSGGSVAPALRPGSPRFVEQAVLCSPFLPLYPSAMGVPQSTTGTLVALNPW